MSDKTNLFNKDADNKKELIKAFEVAKKELELCGVELTKDNEKILKAIYMLNYDQ